MKCQKLLLSLKSNTFFQQLHPMNITTSFLLLLLQLTYYIYLLLFFSLSFWVYCEEYRKDSTANLCPNKVCIILTGGGSYSCKSKCSLVDSLVLSGQFRNLLLKKEKEGRQGRPNLTFDCIAGKVRETCLLHKHA